MLKYNDFRDNKIWKSVHLRIEMYWSMSSWAQVEEAWGCVSGLFCCHISDKHAVWGLAPWNLQNGMTSKHFSFLGSTWHRLQVWQGSWETFCHDGSWKPGTSRFLHSEQALLSSVPGKHEAGSLPIHNGKWKLKPVCDILSVFKYLEELQGQRHVCGLTTEINLVHLQIVSATKYSCS